MKKQLKKSLILGLILILTVNSLAGCDWKTVLGTEQSKTEASSATTPSKTTASNENQAPAMNTLAFELSADQSYYIVTGIGTYQNAALVIPATYREKPVRAIREFAFANCESITSLTVSNGITRIEESAFYNCKNLQSVTLPSTIEKIEKNTFRKCQKLVSVTIPNGIHTIGRFAFAACGSLESITLPESILRIEDFAFQFNSRMTEFVFPPNLSYLGDSVFAGCAALTSVSIPSGITSIGKGTFDSCTFTSITIPSHITSIGICALRNYHLESVIFENPDGWSAGDTSLTRRDLSDPAVAAELLGRTYNEMEWVRQDP